MICYFWLFNHRLKFQDLCNDCHDLAMLCLNISNITIIPVKNVDYCCIIHNISKSEAINLAVSAVLVLFFFTFFCLVYIKWMIL